MNNLERRGVLKKYPMISLPLQVVLCGILLTFATPLCCAIFPQTASVSTDFLEPELQVCKTHYVFTHFLGFSTEKIYFLMITGENQEISKCT